MAMLRALLVLGILGYALAVLPPQTFCPNVTPMKHFNPSKYEGRWHEYKARGYISNIPIKCIANEFKYYENYTFQSTQSFRDNEGNQYTNNFSTYIPDLSEPCKLKKRFPHLPDSMESDYWILGTDYRHFSVVYQCTQGYDSYVQIAIMTRKKEPQDWVLEKAMNVINKNNLQNYPLFNIDWQGCEEN